jgi:hypothetical protein
MRECQTLSIADLLDNSDNKDDKKGAEGGEEEKALAQDDLQNDPVLRLLLQPRSKEAKVDLLDSASTSAGTSSAHSSPGAVSVLPEFPAAEFGDAPDEEVDLFEALRAELREARARATRLTVTAPVVVESGILPPGFKAPPGLPAPEGNVSPPPLLCGPPPGL